MWLQKKKSSSNTTTQILAAKVCKVIDLIDFEMVALSSLPKDSKND